MLRSESALIGQLLQTTAVLLRHHNLTQSPDSLFEATVSEYERCDGAFSSFDISYSNLTFYNMRPLMCRCVDQVRTRSQLYLWTCISLVLLKTFSVRRTDKKSLKVIVSSLQDCKVTSRESLPSGL